MNTSTNFVTVQRSGGTRPCGESLDVRQHAACRVGHEHRRAAFRGPCRATLSAAPVAAGVPLSPAMLVLLAIALSVAGPIVLRNVTGG